MSKEYFVRAEGQYAVCISISGPFSSRQTAERFAVGLADSGKCLGVTIYSEESEDDDNDDE